jgi:hypothetical protein
MAGGKSAAEMARALEVHSSGLYRWRRELDEHGGQAFIGAGRKRADDDRVAELERMVTTDSAHPLPVYLNLSLTMEVPGLNQLWIADITYIRLEEEFICQAVVLDAYSRRVIGWSLDDTMAESLTVAALKIALSEREVSPGLVHHSERGVQNAAHGYTQLLHENSITISMSRKGKSVGQRGLRIVYEDAQTRGGQPGRIPESGPMRGRGSGTSSNPSTTKDGCIRLLSYRSPNEFEISLAPELGK